MEDGIRIVAMARTINGELLQDIVTWGIIAIAVVVYIIGLVFAALIRRGALPRPAVLETKAYVKKITYVILAFQVLTGVYLAMHYVVDMELVLMSEGGEMGVLCYRTPLNNGGVELGIIFNYFRGSGGMIRGTIDKYRSSMLAEVIRDPEGDLMPDNLKRYLDTRIFRYSFGVICVLSLVSRWIYRLSSLTGLGLASEVLAIGCTASIVLFYSILCFKAVVLLYTFVGRVSTGYYGRTNKGGRRGNMRGNRNIWTGVGRAAIQVGRLIGGTVITTGALIQGANEIGKAMNRGNIGTDTATEVAKKLGVYKYDGSNQFQPRVGNENTTPRKEG